MRGILPVILLLITTICCAEDWIYAGSAKEFIPMSSDLGEHWNRSLIRTVNEKNELNKLFSKTAPHDVETGVTTNYELFRKKHKIRELSDVEFYSEDEVQGKQTYQLVIFLFQSSEALGQYWSSAHKENLDSTIFTTLIEGNHCCIFRLQNTYVSVSSKGLRTECERIAGAVFSIIQHSQKGPNQSE